MYKQVVIIARVREKNLKDDFPFQQFNKLTL